MHSRNHDALFICFICTQTHTLFSQSFLLRFAGYNCGAGDRFNACYRAGYDLPFGTAGNNDRLPTIYYCEGVPSVRKLPWKYYYRFAVPFGTVLPLALPCPALNILSRDFEPSRPLAPGLSQLFIGPFLVHVDLFSGKLTSK